MKSRAIKLLAAIVLACLAAAGVHAALQRRVNAAVSLAEMAPEGALLSIESPDFAALLHAWTNSAEARRWMASDNEADFARSKLFERLHNEQEQFGSVAGLDPAADFLNRIAGGRSLFAWYDIGTLQFLYITEMPAGEAEKTPLLALRDKFEQRSVGDATFYVRSEGGGDANALTQSRTVAFAVYRDTLLLATSEPLMAEALALAQKPGEHTLATDPWYANTVAAANREPGELRMALNLTKIVPSPYFRSYWAPQNITAMKAYSAVLVDLYREPGRLREERLLLAKDSEKPALTADLAPLLRYVPQQSGVYRAIAQPDAQTAVDTIEERLLAKTPAAYRDEREAEATDISVPTAGETSELEERIDAAPVVTASRADQLAALRQLLQAAAPRSLAVYGSSDPPAPDAVFLRSHSAVLLESATAWNEGQLQSALRNAAAPLWTVSAGTLAWQTEQRNGQSWSKLSGYGDLAMAVRGNVLLLATDGATLERMLSASSSAPASARVATVIAGFDHRAERAAFLARSQQLDRFNRSAPRGAGTQPPFFAGNIASLSDTFADLDSETFTAINAAGHTTQTVLYRWHAAP